MEVVTVDGGAEATSEGEVVGRLVAQLKDDKLRGRHAWSALGDHFAREPELYRDLYAVAGPAWLEDGAANHYVVVASADDVVWAWLGCAFAIEQVHAERPLDDVAEPPAPAGFAIRQAGLGELDVARRGRPPGTDHHGSLARGSGLVRSRAPERRGVPRALA